MQSFVPVHTLLIEATFFGVVVGYIASSVFAFIKISFFADVYKAAGFQLHLVCGWTFI